MIISTEIITHINILWYIDIHTHTYVYIMYVCIYIYICTHHTCIERERCIDRYITYGSST